MNKENLKIIKDTAQDFFSKMTFLISSIEVNPISINLEDILKESKDNNHKNDYVDLIVRLNEPQVLIGEKGQTLQEIQKLLRMVLNKKLKNNFYLNLDINDYKKKKIDNLKRTAKDIANDVLLYKSEKSLFPMPAFERRIIHEELSNRDDIKTESRGDGENRRVVVMPK